MYAHMHAIHNLPLQPDALKRHRVSLSCHRLSPQSTTAAASLSLSRRIHRHPINGMQLGVQGSRRTKHSGHGVARVA